MMIQTKKIVILLSEHVKPIQPNQYSHKVLIGWFAVSYGCTQNPVVND